MWRERERGPNASVVIIWRHGTQWPRLLSKVWETWEPLSHQSPHFLFACLRHSTTCPHEENTLHTHGKTKSIAFENKLGFPIIFILFRTEIVPRVPVSGCLKHRHSSTFMLKEKNSWQEIQECQDVFRNSSVAAMLPLQGLVKSKFIR